MEKTEQNDLVRVFVDTEFTGFDVKADLISIGLVSDILGCDKGSIGRHAFYAETDASIDAENENIFFLEDHVIPHLGGVPRDDLGSLALKLKNWIEAIPAGRVEVFTDCPHWDWFWITELFARSGWPSNLVRAPVDASILLVRPEYDAVVDAVYENQGLRRHHALDDAIALMQTYAELKGPIETPGTQDGHLG